MPTNPCRVLPMVLALPAAVACEEERAETRDAGPGPLAPNAGAETRFRDLNGVMWIYTTANDVRFADLEADLDTWKARGIRTLGIYSPYHGEKDQWLGAAPPRLLRGTAPERHPR